MYKLTFKNKEIELPKYTMAVMDKIEALDKFTGSGSELIRLMYNFIEDLIGGELVQELLGAVDDVDTNDVNILFSSIIKCYKKPFEKYQLEEAGSIINAPQIQKSLDAIDKVVKANKSND